MRPTSEILAALVSRLEAVQWNASPAFHAVHRYDSNRLSEAFQELILAPHPRLALVVWTGERWEIDPASTLRRARRATLVTLVLSDRVLGSREDAATWGDATTPGVIRLKDLVIPAVTGRILANPNGIDCFPGAIEPLPILTEGAETGSAAMGRVALTIDLECHGGAIDPTPSPGPVR
ncbi:MAG: hypothetical protein KF833_18630 [Verrucomicrobiae bacterium]|nr:hypothetical protein [Verrucomicrobiae bacterium]